MRLVLSYDFNDDWAQLQIYQTDSVVYTVFRGHVNETYAYLAELVSTAAPVTIEELELYCMLVSGDRVEVVPDRVVANGLAS